jgi:DNA primase
MSNLTFQQAVEQIKNNLDIVEVVSRYVVLKKTGRAVLGLCPFHNEKTPSFTVTPSRQIFKCFGCGEGGDVFTFLQKIHNQNFAEVVKEQAEIFNIEQQAGKRRFNCSRKICYGILPQ